MNRRPIALIDCDGVLADFAGEQLAFLSQALGVKLTHDVIDAWDICRSTGIAPLVDRRPEVALDAVNYMAAPGRCYGLAVLHGAVAGMAALRELADVRIVTTPFADAPTWQSEREEWLRRHFGIQPRDVIHTHHKDLVRGDIFVDDRDDHVNRWQRAHVYGQAILWPAPHNRAISGWPQRVGDWRDVLVSAGWAS